jgi:glutamate/tyrosine decarboxylase-like PLP-dependent enzyme
VSTPKTFQDFPDLLEAALRRMAEGFTALPPTDEAANAQSQVRQPAKQQAGQPALPADRLEEVLRELATRLQDNFPYFHPLYAGQMITPPHPVARLAYALAMFINPNNHALDGGRATSRLEKEAVTEIARMFGWDTHLGHLTSGGTMANLEALWVAGQLHPGKKIVASQQAHYTHQRISAVLQLPFESVPCDRAGRLDLTALKARLQTGSIGTVVATFGTTATGAIDPLPELLDLQRQYDFRLHADGAYGGYFVLAGNLEEDTRRAYACLGRVDSVVVDPHKRGLQPYGCGCVLFRDPTVGRFYKHDSPYTYFSSQELHLGEISLECSRPGAAAAALWATQRLLPLKPGGEFAALLQRTREAALGLYARLRDDARFIAPPFPPQLDILVWAPHAKSVSAASALSERVFHEAARRHLHLALALLPVEFFNVAAAGMEKDLENIRCLRSVLMQPDHYSWQDQIWSILADATTAALSS